MFAHSSKLLKKYKFEGTLLQTLGKAAMTDYPTNQMSGPLKVFDKVSLVCNSGSLNLRDYKEKDGKLDEEWVSQNACDTCDKIELLFVIFT